MRELITGFRVALILWVLTAVIYPFFMLLTSQIFLNDQANGSLVRDARGEVVGSALIGQTFTSDAYFWSRPSTTNYSSFTAEEFDPNKLENLSHRTGVSGASNLAPSNPALLERIRSEVTRSQAAGTPLTADTIYTSGSSLDPHISVEAARAQINRVASARGLDTNRVEILISKYTEGRFLGIFGEPGVNVLKLNLELDRPNVS